MKLGPSPLTTGNLLFQPVYFGKAREVSRMSVDPVCKMKVDEKKAAATYEYKGTTYYFCAVGCKETFAKNPEAYLKK